LSDLFRCTRNPSLSDYAPESKKLLHLDAAGFCLMQFIKESTDTAGKMRGDMSVQLFSRLWRQLLPSAWTAETRLRSKLSDAALTTLDAHFSGIVARLD
jgi:hypothetical protein